MPSQIVCDNNMVLTDVLAGWPGSVHDSRVLRNSELFATSGNKFPCDYHLIGDGGYPLLRYIFRQIVSDINIISPLVVKETSKLLIFTLQLSMHQNMPCNWFLITIMTSVVKGFYYFCLILPWLPKLKNK